MPTFLERLRHSWNAFINNKDPTAASQDWYGVTSYYRPDRVRLSRGNERSIVTSIYNRIATDCAAIQIKHVRVDGNERYKETIDSGLNYALNIEANIDQTGRAFRQDAVMSMLDEGVVAIVPIDTDIDPKKSASFDIKTLRTAKIIQWYPQHIKVQVYNDRTGKREELIFPKKICAIVENPFYSVMNEPNSTLQRLIRKLTLLDDIDEQTSAGKLDLIIQLPYIVKTEARRQQAENRRKDIEMQLSGSKYGIAYTDGTEKITQLSRPLENNLLKQIEYLTSTLQSQLGITEDILKGTADEQTQLNYTNHIVEPILTAFTDEYTRKFLTKTARTQGQKMMYFRDPFKLVPINNIAEIADKFTRNEILSSNEVRALVGYAPVDDPKADELRNKNINQSNEELDPANTMESEVPEGGADMGEKSNSEDSMSEEEINQRLKELEEAEKQLAAYEKEMGGA